MSGLLPSDADARDGDYDAAETGTAAPDELDGTERTGGDDESDGNGSAESTRVCWLDDEEADALIGSLSSDTARSLLTALHEEPHTASELADRLDTSVQNVRHHLGNLDDAGLVTDAGTRYSVKGREMTVYEPSNERLVVAVGSDDDRSSFLDSLRGLVGVAALLGVGSLAVQWAFGSGGGLGGPAGAPRVGDSVGGAAAPLLGLVPPGVAFLAGGLLVLGAVLAVEYARAD
ncbi:ArsR/SmtB family transcription factor [Candidatus Halobonum tyrrellensis]|uniref:Regulatory protein ArsR n=1 Tax=Candidatus Halobonum tyrrellensis G22 TaxID=1324957 RepID=V4IWS1_9EURY|nr:winged helix-turn-helix domain-containing protein [Candidatus Halobonum tyrrellensis]ESP87642.1 regulatory protein ArsR [Candidatus Halobonum tyrrellensis G22]